MRMGGIWEKGRDEEERLMGECGKKKKEKKKNKKKGVVVRPTWQWVSLKQ